MTKELITISAVASMLLCTAAHPLTAAATEGSPTLCATSEAHNTLCACEKHNAQQTLAPEYRVDSATVGTLALSVDALAFFKDNEYDGEMVRGYSLPGFRVQPRLSYTPLQQVRLEAGMYAIVYDGANKYPSYVFHDIAHWKGNQHQHGAHALPFFRATASLGDPTPECPQGRPSRTTIVVGDIYGGATHQLLQPLYNAELQLTDDPEMGAQVLVERKRWRSDLWVNWQSYIYEEDTHQEAFTVGWTQRINLTPQHLKPTDSGTAAGSNFYVPLQIVAQHRGGEQDLPELQLGVQTIANGAVGLGYEWRPQTISCAGAEARTHTAGSAPKGPSATTTEGGPLKRLCAEACGLMAYQQSGHLWPFDVGGALWTSVAADLAVGRGAARRDGTLSVKLGLLHAPHQFCTLYGSPFFGTVSVKREDLTFDSMTTGYWAVQYARTFAGAYTIAAKADGYISQGRAPFSFGVYFSASPSFILKRWRNAQRTLK